MIKLISISQQRILINLIELKGEDEIGNHIGDGHNDLKSSVVKCCKHLFPRFQASKMIRKVIIENWGVLEIREIAQAQSLKKKVERKSVTHVDLLNHGCTVF